MESHEAPDRAAAAAQLDALRADREALAAFLLCLRGMMALYRRLTGFWVDGFRRGPTRRAIVVWVVVVLAVLGAGFAVESHWRGAMVVAGAVLGIGLVLVNQWWARIYVAEAARGDVTELVRFRTDGAPPGAGPASAGEAVP
ncbi:hypothetical protein E4P41_19495 [Geodermatophilus sp. DF01-2]|uniref:hypothetical protein n=1 Tax=Geodermatophilus sp. DF01-2 TaxID=2559610 RepID=UPI0010747AF6|nr:hypothetical protein [Geodermatophilus sp. DF01_2]TFV54197.1 hypothetical protein E4P41_19495 [Geodermatophilus sp. DF01_2]